MDSAARPREITADRAAGLLRMVWHDGLVGEYPLVWLRANCPCATCREERKDAAADPLRLNVGPPPSADVANLHLVGNYAIRLTWSDGHDTGIYAFSLLREVAPTPGTPLDALPPLLDA